MRKVTNNAHGTDTSFLRFPCQACLIHGQTQVLITISTAKSSCTVFCLISKTAS